MQRLQIQFSDQHLGVIRSLASQTQTTMVDVLRRMTDATASDPVVLGRMFPLSSGSLVIQGGTK